MAKIVDRRTFLKTAAATTAATYAARSLPASAAVADKSLVAVTTPLATFPYADVQLLDGPMKQQFDENHARFLNLDDDRMLKVFRQVAGLPAPGEDMGGWYDLTGFDLTRGDFQRLYRRTQFRTVRFRPGSRLCGHRLGCDASQSQSPGQRLCRDARSQSQVFRRLSTARLHLRQTLLRT